jgi:UDP-glucose 4-epimerase
MRKPLVWTIGAGGLLGSSIVRTCERPFPGSRIPWTDHDVAERALADDLDRFITSTDGGPWRIVWAAGAGTVGTSSASLDSETRILGSFCDLLRERRPAGAGILALASSAGGVFAGASSPPFDASREPLPLSEYGRTKLAQEQIVAERLADRLPVLIARFSNVYGPAQKLGKRQGLVSQLAYAAATRQAVSIYVPLETIRDYIHSDDAASALHTHLAALGDAQVGARMVIIASGEGTTIAQLIRQAMAVTHRRIPVALGTHHSAQVQARDSRFIPTPPAHGSLTPPRPLPVGIREVFDAMVLTLAQSPAEAIA